MGYGFLDLHLHVYTYTDSGPSGWGLPDVPFSLAYGRDGSILCFIDSRFCHLHDFLFFFFFLSCGKLTTSFILFLIAVQNIYIVVYFFVKEVTFNCFPVFTN